MKKTLLLIASAALLLVGCKQENLGLEAGDGEMVSMTVTASVQGEELSKAAIDQDGMGVHADRCIMVLYYGDQVYGRYVADVSGYKATFDVKVPAKRTYNAVFWADCAAEDGGDLYYNTADLKNITLKSAYVGNNDKRDAFFKCKEYTVENKSQSFTAELTRPFAQINVISTDIQALHLVELYPQKVNLSFSAATSFNAMSGECGDAEAITYETDVYKAYDSAKTQLTLSMDYLFASTEQGAVDIEFKAPTEGELKVEYSFTNIPYQRNYRTNIIGNLLTADAHWDVTINPEWNEPDEDVTIVDAGSVAAANEAFANGATRVQITSVGEETNLYLPLTTEEVTIDFANPDKGVTVKYGPAPTKAAGEKPAAVNIATNDVAKFTVTDISNIVWLAGNQVALANALTNATNKQTVALANDITMTGEWTPATTKDGVIFDGKNHVISGMTITDCGKDYAALIGFMTGGEVKNVTVKNANIVYNSGAGSKARGAAIVGISYGGTIENCHAENVSIKGYQKMGGVVGYLAQCNTQFVVRNCSAKNITFTNNTEDLTYQAGGLIGYTQNSNGDILVEGCSVSDITINNLYDGSEGANLPYYCGIFIGSLNNEANKDGLKIELKNNTISGTNTPQIDQMYANTYFGWANNSEKTAGKLATITIDGQEWTPNYPVKNVTKGTSYLTLAKAVEAASAGDEITLENGEYTLPGLSNITIEGIGDNVVVNHSSGSICATSNATIKNVVFNLGQDGYHGFQHASNLVLDGCTFNGFQNTYGSITYKNCTFNQDTYAYNMNAYGAEIVCDNCVFNGKGKAVYVYNEGNDGMYHISFNNCVFNEEVGAGTKCKAAILVKENVNNQKYVVNINNCIANFDKYVPDDPDLTGSSLWNMELKDGVTGTDVTVNLDNEKVYPFTKFSVSDAAGLRNAIKMFNKGKENTEYTIELADGTYSVSDLHVKQADGENKNPRSLLVKATNPGQVVLTPNSDTKTHMIFIVSGCSNYYGSEYITFDGLKFSMPTNPGNGVASHAIYCPREPAKDPIGILLGEEVSRYAHNVNIINCELQGFGTADNSLLNAPQAAGINHVTVDGCVVNNAGYVVNGYFVDTKVLNSKVTNVKACANTNSQGITVENCEISAWNDYCIRSNGGPIIVKNNKFDMTFNGAIKVDEPAAIVYLRGANAPVEATISGNTITKAKIEMWDCYCATAWTVNDKARTAGTGINFPEPETE